jgi:hypothetical protein
MGSGRVGSVGWSWLCYRWWRFDRSVGFNVRELLGNLADDGLTLDRCSGFLVLELAFEEERLAAETRRVDEEDVAADWEGRRFSHWKRGRRKNVNALDVSRIKAMRSIV